MHGTIFHMAGDAEYAFISLIETRVGFLPGTYFCRDMTIQALFLGPVLRSFNVVFADPCAGVPAFLPGFVYVFMAIPALLRFRLLEQSGISRKIESKLGQDAPGIIDENPGYQG